MSNLERMAQSRQRLDESYIETQRIANETVGIGQATLQQLRSQQEILETSEDTLESTDYSIEKSLRVLRNMTWSGMFYNAFTWNPGNEPVSRQIPIQSSSNPNSSKINMIPENTSDKSIENKKKDEFLCHDDEQIDMLARTVDELHAISIATGQALETHNEIVDRISSKTDIVTDKTLEATLKASRITSKRSRPDFVGRFQFIDTTTEKYLTIRDDDQIQLSTRKDRATMFDLYIKENNLLGIQSIKTLKFLGVTVLGSIMISGEYFGRSEECFVNLSGKPSGILVLSRNWGGGGWLKQPYDGETLLLSSTTTSIYDKKDMITFKAQPVLIEEKEK